MSLTLVHTESDMFHDIVNVRLRADMQMSAEFYLYIHVIGEEKSSLLFIRLHGNNQVSLNATGATSSFLRCW